MDFSSLVALSKKIVTETLFSKYVWVFSKFQLTDLKKKTVLYKKSTLNKLLI